MSDELRLIREQIARRMAGSPDAGNTVPDANRATHPSQTVLAAQPDAVRAVQMQAASDAEAAAAKREQAVAMAATARAALQAALAAKESLAEQLRAEREATAAAQAVAAKAREETRDARQKEALARREVEESWQVAECIAKTFDQSMDFSTLGITSPPAAQRRREQQPPQPPQPPQTPQTSMEERSHLKEHELSGDDSRIAIYNGRAESSNSTSYSALERARQTNHSARLSSPRNSDRVPGRSGAEWNTPLSLSVDNFKSTLRAPTSLGPSEQHRSRLAATARQHDRPRSGGFDNHGPDTGAGLRRTSPRDAKLQMNDEIEVLSLRMAEMQRLVVEQRGAMAKLRTLKSTNGRDPISREAARLQHIDAELRELEQTLLQSGHPF